MTATARRRLEYLAAEHGWSVNHENVSQVIYDRTPAGVTDRGYLSIRFTKNGAISGVIANNIVTRPRTRNKEQIAAEVLAAPAVITCARCATTDTPRVALLTHGGRVTSVQCRACGLSYQEDKS